MLADCAEHAERLRRRGAEVVLLTGFVYTFARYDLAHGSGMHDDFDMASAGLVKVFNDGRRGRRYPDMSWEPKVAFEALADCYAR